MFKPVDSKVSFPKMEEDILQFWKEKNIFRRSTEDRSDRPIYVMYEGPPTANNNPGTHHVLSRVFKDVVPRYKTMKGYYVPRKGGWDTHGLPVELEIEKALNLSSKPEIESYGVEKFNQHCRESVMRYVKEWEALTDRIAFWLDLEQAYVTFTNDYIESGWWIMKRFWDKGLVYQGYKTTPHCPRCGTSLSSHEVALGYKDDTVDPSVYVKFRLSPEASAEAGATIPPAADPSTYRGSSEGTIWLGYLPTILQADIPTYFLAWTTTPWTLPGNTAVAVSPDAEYAVVELEAKDGGQERLILASALVSSAIKDPHKVLGYISGKELVGLRYEPLYNPGEVQVDVRQFVKGGAGTAQLQAAERAEHWNYPVIAGDFVSMEDGTGIVHIAPAFGEVDFQVGQSEGLYFVQPVDLAGRMTFSIPWIANLEENIGGRFVKEADPRVLADLDNRGLLYRAETITHTYPFCWRCDSPLLYYVKTSWYIRTTAVKDRLISGNQQINWRPEHIKNGRFGDWLENNVDWAVSRERYWGTPLNVWRCEGCNKYQCVGSVEELASQKGLDGYSEGMDLHRPYIDRATFVCGECGGRMSRESDVLDAWFDSGAMPVAQWHYPFENRDKIEGGISSEEWEWGDHLPYAYPESRDKIESNTGKDIRPGPSSASGQSYYPADYICEAVDQTRGWFYTLHAIATLLNYCDPDTFTSSICYRNVICLGHVLDAKGEKMSKSRGNVVEPWPVINANGADALRWYLYTASPAGNPRRFSSDLVGESLRKFLLTLWNTYSFFVIYANIDNYSPNDGVGAQQPALSRVEGSELDRWIISELNRLVKDVTGFLEDYNPTDAGRRIQDFVDDLSNWYVRRSRRRFWKSENDGDKRAAYDTLYNCLVTLSKVLAPFTPFVTEEMYQNLVRSVDSNAPESVHLAEYPMADESLIDQRLSEDTALVMRIVSLGRAARNKAGVKVRQPLAMVRVSVRPGPGQEGEMKALQQLQGQVLEELNVKQLTAADPMDPDYYDPSVELKMDLVGRKYGPLTPQIAEAVKSADQYTKRRWYTAVSTGQRIPLQVQDQQLQVTSEELSPVVTAKPGWSITTEAGYVVGVSTEVTPELADEGLARELVHRLQTMRRTANFDIADHIVTYYHGSEEIGRIMKTPSLAEYIRQETLSTKLVEGEPASDSYQETIRIDGHAVTLGVLRKG